MTVADRLFICRMLEKMECNKDYAIKLGISNASIFNRQPITGEESVSERKGK